MQMNSAGPSADLIRDRPTTVMDDSINQAITRMVATYGIVITLIIVIVVLIVLGIGILARSWIERFARQRLELDLETHRAELGRLAETTRAHLQQRLHELSLFSVERHRAYSETYRSLLRVEGAYSNLARDVYSFSDFGDASRVELESLMRRRKILPPVVREVLDVWDRDRIEGGRMIDEALRSARVRRADRLFQSFTNVVLQNELYFTPEVSDALSRARRAVTRLSAEIHVPDDSRYEELETKQAIAQGAVVDVRRSMQVDLRERHEVMPASE
jgi:hypothetical protein